MAQPHRGETSILPAQRCGRNASTIARATTAKATQLAKKLLRQ